MFLFAVEDSKQYCRSGSSAHRRARGEYVSYTVEGNSLKDFGIFRGDHLISRCISNKKEVFNGALCVVKFGTNLQVMKLKYNRDGSVTFYHSDRQETGKLSAFSVVGIVEAFQRLI